MIGCQKGLQEGHFQRSFYSEFWQTERLKRVLLKSKIVIHHFSHQIRKTGYSLSPYDRKSTSEKWVERCCEFLRGLEVCFFDVTDVPSMPVTYTETTEGFWRGRMGAGPEIPGKCYRKNSRPGFPRKIFYHILPEHFQQIFFKKFSEKSGIPEIQMSCHSVEGSRLHNR